MGRRRLASAMAAGVLAGLAAPGHGATASPAEAGTGRYLVQFERGATEQGLDQLRAAGGRVVLELRPQNAVAAEIPTDEIDELRRSRAVAIVEVDPPRAPLAQAVPYGVEAVHARTVEASAAGNRTIAIIDSGLLTSHEDFAGLSVSGNDSRPWDQDGCGHGTHVAGTIAAADNDLGVVGVAPGSRLYIVRVFGDDCAFTRASNVIDGLNQSVAAGANIVNLSLGWGVRSAVEESAFNSLWDSGILSIAAAGNGGYRPTSFRGSSGATYTYPAAYASVVSVGAVDRDNNRAPFSQVNPDLELTAPGVAVLSTVPWHSTTSLIAGDTEWTARTVSGSASTSGTTGVLVDGGSCDQPGEWAGAIVVCRRMIMRGDISLGDKVRNVASGGGVAVIKYEADDDSPTIGNRVVAPIPVIAMSGSDGAAALAHAGQQVTVVSQTTKPASGYETWNGTSMATAHVSGVAARVWSCNPSWTNTRVRAALQATAKDLGSAGRDPAFGFGLVQADAALRHLLGADGTCAATAGA